MVGVGVVQGQKSQNRKWGVGEKLGEGGCVRGRER